MKRIGLALAALLLSSGVGSAEKAVDMTFPAYVDSDVCSRLMLGPVTDKRISCSKDTAKDGSSPAIVRGSDNMVLGVRNQKSVKRLVGEFANVTGQVREKAGNIKVASAEVIKLDEIPPGEMNSRLLDVRNYRTSGDRVYEQVRHTLAMMPYITEFDFISFAMVGDQVVLTGWTIRQTNRNDARRRVQAIEGVGSVTNNILVLPLGRMDMNIRAQARMRLQRFLPMYFWGSGSAIKIIVKNGNIILLGAVVRQADKDLANIQCRGVPGAFHVFNLLRVEPGKEKKG